MSPREIGQRLEPYQARILGTLALAGVLAGAVLWAVGARVAADVAWAATDALMLVPLTWSVVRRLLRRDVGVDAIALFSMAGALALGEYLAGAVVALMLAGGNALEEYAGKRARGALSTLIARQPVSARRRTGDRIEEVAIDQVHPGDILIVRAGEVIPADGTTVADAVIDESAITGESLPVARAAGSTVLSGTANAGEVFELRVTREASQSAYARLVSLVREAETERAPLVRLADRYAAFFLPVTIVAAAIAWAVSGDPVRALAVFVVATPCPLILAAPIALIAGVSRAARAGVIVKGSGVIERLGRSRSVLLDKTGTLTLGTPEIDRVVLLDGIAADELIRLSASLDQFSAHTLAEALVQGAVLRRLPLSFPEQVEEKPGQGIEGNVDGYRVAVGSPAWLTQRGYNDAPTKFQELEDSEDGRSSILIGIDGRLAGVIVMSDRPRDDAGDLTERLHHAGISQVAMVTGDRESVAHEVGRQLGIDRVYAEQTPEAKLETVRATQANPTLRPVVMVGDGINDAPALALADVGIAMGTIGATVSSETADAVIVVDHIDRVLTAITIGRRSLSIANQSILTGMTLSLGAMALAGAGYLPPVWGALLQELIDVTVILNALRALR
jgi:heavy metal translocating P-type ATPase